jgi:hypothetical protein
MVSVKMLKAVGRHIDVAIPWNARNKIIWMPVWAIPHARMNDARRKQPLILIILLPIKSAIEPASRRQHPFARLEFFSYASDEVRRGKLTSRLRPA